MKYILRFLLLPLVVQAATAYAYIPEYGTILSKSASQHGKGIYKIEHELTLKKDNESYSVKETWWVQSEGAMRLSLEGLGILKGAVSGVQIYEGSQRHYLEGQGKVRTQRTGDDWLQPFLVFRNSKYARQRLISMKIAPPDSANDRPPHSPQSEIKYSPAPFLRLSRVGGSIAYAIGNAPAMPPDTTPAAWIEQDQFVFRKIRTSTDVVWRADDYVKHVDGFWYPKTQIYSWGPYSVTVQTTSVQAVTKTPQLDALFKAKSLTGVNDTLRLPEADVLRDFYSRFR